MKKLKFNRDLDDTYVGDCLIDCIFEHNYEVAFYMCSRLFANAYGEINENEDFKGIIEYIKCLVEDDINNEPDEIKCINNELDELDVNEFKKVCLKYFYDVVQDDEE